MVEHSCLQFLHPTAVTIQLEKKIHPLDPNQTLDVYLSSLRYDEEMAQSEMSDRDLRSRSGQSVGFKGNRTRDPGKTGILTWK